MYGFIRLNPQRLTGLADGSQSGNQDLGQELLALVDASKQDQAKEAMQRLFPKLERMWSNRGYGSEFLNAWDRERRVCIAKRFPAYFGFGIGNDALSSQELKDFIANITDAGHVRSKVAACVAVVRRTGGTRAAVLLEELISNVELVPTNSLPGAIITLFDVADLFANPLDELGSGFPGIPAIWRFWFLMKRLLERLDEPERGEAIRSAFDRAGALPGLCFALTTFRASLGRDSEIKPEDAGAPLVDATIFEDLEGKLRTRLRAASQDGSLLAGPGLIANLVEWNRLGDETAVRAWTDGVLGDDEAILRLAAAAIQFSRAHTVGDRIIRRIPLVHRPSLEKVANVERMLQRLSAIAEAGPTPESLAVIRNFFLGLNLQFPLSHGEDEEGA